MPGMDGFALLHALRADPATEAVPVIMLTSGDPHDPDHIVRDPQPDAFVKKSADLEPLLAEVREALTAGANLAFVCTLCYSGTARLKFRFRGAEELAENKRHRPPDALARCSAELRVPKRTRS